MRKEKGTESRKVGFFSLIVQLPEKYALRRSESSNLVH